MNANTGRNILAEFQSLSALIKELADEGNETAAILLDEFNACGKALVDYVLECSNEISKLNTQKEETEEEVQKLNAKLEALEKSVPKADFEYCLKLAEKKYSKYWHIMEKNSKTFLATATYLFNFLRAQNVDFSSVVLEYAKALEEELKQKVYFSFVKEQSKKPILPYKSQFTTCVARYKEKGVFFFEFTMMFQQFKVPNYWNDNYWPYLHQELQAKGWRMNILTNPKFIKEGTAFAENYRNRAAHSYTFTQQDAVACSEKAKELTYTFLSAYPSKK